jgi:Lipid A core - O-antigen ligase and related enzymes
VVLGTGFGIYQLKKDSANGRLFTWKITALAIKESPVKGSALGGFPAAYADAQMTYFKSGKGTATEKLVAGSPEYAFNEYLRIFTEQGISGGIIFLLLTFLIIRSGVRNRKTGAAGSFLTLSVFASASYPFYLWEFLVAWVLLGTICVSKTESLAQRKVNTPNKGRRMYISSLLFTGVLVAASFICAKHQASYYQANKEWKKLRPLYTMRVHQSVVEDYERLYPILNYNPKFVFEYAVALNATEQRERADSVLSRGLQLSCDPMFYNVKGRNYHEMGEYNKAEACYVNSTWLLPERIYPYYLLTKLYADSANYKPKKMLRAANAVLEKEPKVHSMAITEMRMEVKAMLKEKE